MKKSCQMLMFCAAVLLLISAASQNVHAIETFTMYQTSFETDSQMEDWEFLDEDGDGRTWMRVRNDLDDTYALASQSYDIEEGALAPDNWAYTPEIELLSYGTARLSYRIFVEEESFKDEYYSVYVCEAGGQPELLVSETVSEAEACANEFGIRVFDLSAYKGKAIRIAFRHHNVSGKHRILLDDLKFSTEMPYTIEEVSVSLDAPEAGKEITTDAQIDSSHRGYYIASVEWMEQDTHFVEGKSYSVTVTVEADNQYIFTDYREFKPFINGKEAVLLSRDLYQIKFGYTFSAVSNPLPKMKFNDIHEENWYYKDVEYVYEKRLMNGMTAEVFGPKLPTSRGMVVTILYRIEGEPQLTRECPFDDVRENSYYEDAITWASERHIVEGYSNKVYAPDDPITREQFASILCRYAKQKDAYDENDCAMLVGFGDHREVSSWANESMSWAVGCGLINGMETDGGLFLAPQGQANRAQIAAMLHRYLEK